MASKGKGRRIEESVGNGPSLPPSKLSLSFESTGVSTLIYADAYYADVLSVHIYDGRQGKLLFSDKGKPLSRIDRLSAYDGLPSTDGVAMVTYTCNHFKDNAGNDRLSFNLLSVIMLSDD